MVLNGMIVLNEEVVAMLERLIKLNGGVEWYDCDGHSDSLRKSDWVRSVVDILEGVVIKEVEGLIIIVCCKE